MSDKVANNGETHKVTASNRPCAQDIVKSKTFCSLSTIDSSLPKRSLPDANSTPFWNTNIICPV